MKTGMRNEPAEQNRGSDSVERLLGDFSHSGVWCCEHKSRCKWQGFALNHGIGWGVVPKNTGAYSWREAHDRECGGRLIQLVPPNDRDHQQPEEAQ
jgi:hypothetical protein